MSKLGVLQELVVDLGDGDEVVLRFRRPTSSEWTSYQGEMAGSVSGDRPGIAIAEINHRYGSLIVMEAEGSAFEEGLTPEEKLDLAKRELLDPISLLGQRIFFESRGQRIDMGKSAKVFGPSSGLSSAPSKGQAVNGSDKSPNLTGISSVEIAPDTKPESSLPV